MKIALFPGSFDPFTKGHEDLVQRALLLFDKVVIGIGSNSTKNNLFTAEKRQILIKKLFEKTPQIETVIYSDLTIDCCKRVGAEFILRGLRSTTDFDFERAIAQMNHDLNTEVETIFMMTAPHLSHISSTIVRDIIHHHGDPLRFVPGIIAEELKKQ